MVFRGEPNIRCHIPRSLIRLRACRDTEDRKKKVFEKRKRELLKEQDLKTDMNL
jgi:hypothetical protein